MTTEQEDPNLVCTHGDIRATNKFRLTCLLTVVIEPCMVLGREEVFEVCENRATRNLADVNR